jgi:hypothetical protein
MERNTTQQEYDKKCDKKYDKNTTRIRQECDKNTTRIRQEYDKKGDKKYKTNV